MKKSRYAWDETKYNRFFKKEGRGQGTGQDYRPWLAIYDVSSNGRSHRIKGWKTNRTHHLLSDLERNFFYLLEWSDAVIDIREQFPLDLDETQLIAKDMGIKHPADQSSGFPWVFTTDFLMPIKGRKEGKLKTNDLWSRHTTRYFKWLHKPFVCSAKLNP